MIITGHGSRSQAGGAVGQAPVALPLLDDIITSLLSFVGSFLLRFRQEAEWFAWIVVELFGTHLGWCWTPLQGSYSLMDLVNLGHFLFFSTRPRLRFRLCGWAHSHCFRRPRRSAL